MDSVSQMALGAALGELVLGRHVGRRGAVLGAVLGTLPDLDVLVPYADAVDSFTRHRSWSHSLLVLTAASLPIAWLARRLLGRSSGASIGDSAARHGPPTFARWWAAAWLILITHPLLDAFTVYGTQLWWPLPLRPVAIGSVFIIDPLYTVPLLVGIVWSWRHRTALARRANAIGLGLSTGYLALTLIVQAQVAGVARESLTAEGLDASRLLVLPLPMSVLWRVVALDGDTYREGWRSVFDGGSRPTFRAHGRGEDPLGVADSYPAVTRLDWFTNGFFRARERDGTLVLTDLRMGAESNYVFSFAVAERNGGDADGWRPIVARELPPEVDLTELGRLVRRIVDERALEPAGATGRGPGATGPSLGTEAKDGRATSREAGRMSGRTGETS